MTGRFIVLGIDALDLDVLAALEDELTHLPAFATSRPLQTTIPPETPVAWSAAATGCNPGKYGIFDFLGRDPESYLPQLTLTSEERQVLKTEYTSGMRGTPFWRTLSEQGTRTTVARWPVTFPAEEVNGRMLSGLGTVDIKGRLNHYFYYTEEVDIDDEEKCIEVAPEDGHIETHLSGPVKAGVTGQSAVTEPLTVDIHDDAATLSWGEQEHRVEAGEWSGMFAAEFSTGVFQSASALFAVYLVSTEPFRMYVSAMQIDPRDQFYRITTPESYGEELVEDIGLFPTLGMPSDTNAVKERVLSEEAFVQQVDWISSVRQDQFWHAFDRFEDGVMSFVFDAGDRLKHIFWENGFGDEHERVADPVRRYYRQMDEFVGTLKQRLAADTTLLVCSDHGFTDFRWQVNLNRWLEQEGYLSTASDDELFSGVDWSETQAYAVGFTSIYINREGREGEGIVPAGQARDLADEIAGKLERFAHDGDAVVKQVYRTADVYSGPYTDEAPELVVGFADGYRGSWRSAIGGFDEDIVFANDSPWCGDHLLDRSLVPGTLLTDKPVSTDAPALQDVGATVLDAFNADRAETVDGTPLFDR